MAERSAKSFAAETRKHNEVFEGQAAAVAESEFKSIFAERDSDERQAADSARLLIRHLYQLQLKDLRNEALAHDRSLRARKAVLIRRLADSAAGVFGK